MSKHSRKTIVRFKSLKFLGYSNYAVGDDGSVWRYVRSRDLWKVLKLKVHRDGYAMVRLYSGLRRSKHFQVHRLVLLAFVGPCPEGMQCRHFPDGDKKNNQLDNLCWGTPSQNHLDKVLQGRSNHGKHYNLGVDSSRAKLTEKQVIKIRELFSEGRYNQVELATRYGVVNSTISGIVRGKYWTHLGGPRSRGKLLNGEVDEIRRLFATGQYTRSELAVRFGVHSSTISFTVRHKGKR